MTETEHRTFLESTEYREWAALHQPVAAGEALTDDEQAGYDAISNRMDSGEGQQFATAAARTRAQVEALESENQRLLADHNVLIHQLPANKNR